MSPRRAKVIRDQAGKNDDPGEALREHLVATAERLLEERQITEITTRDIAREAEVSDGVLYNYFASKNDLLVTALVRRFARDVQRFLERLPEPGTATVAKNLEVFARAMFDLNAGALPIVAGLIADPPLLHKFLYRDPPAAVASTALSPAHRQIPRGGAATWPHRGGERGGGHHATVRRHCHDCARRAVPAPPTGG